MANNDFTFANNVETLSSINVTLGLFALSKGREEIFDLQLENQGIVDENTMSQISDFGEQFTKFASSFVTTPGVVQTGQSALAVRSANLAAAERRVNNIIERGQQQKEAIAKQAERQQRQLLGQFIGGTVSGLTRAASLGGGR